MTTIAFIGVGNMGGPMARNLSRRAMPVRAFDLSAAAVKLVTDAGATASGTANDAVAGRRSRHHHAARRTACACGLSRKWCSRTRQERRAADRLLDHRHRVRTRGPCRGARSGASIFSMRRFPAASAARKRARLPSCAAAARRLSSAHSPFSKRWASASCCGRRWRGAGGEDLQQHVARDFDDRNLRGIRAGRKAGPRPAEIIRHHVRRPRANAGR